MFAGRRACTVGCALLLTALMPALAGCGGSSAGKGKSAPASGQTATTNATSATGTAGAGHSASASAGGVSATLTATTHTPKVNRPWPVQLTATRAGRPAKASVSYAFLFAGRVVARRSHYVFTGHFADTLSWPPSAVGYPLTLRAVVVSGAATINLDYPVQVVR